MNFVATTFGENLRRQRRRAGISQEELGFRASLHRTEIGLLERGARVPRIDTIIKLATGLEVAPAALLAGIAWTPPGRVASGTFSLSGDGDGQASTDVQQPLGAGE
jgi:transcriptional regulator with XRE-family HTH domain